MARKSERHPFSTGFGNKIGQGQDSVVLPLKGPTKGTERQDVVVKKNHPFKREGSSPAERARRERGALYLKKKYELLKFFLDDFIPWSAFVVGEEQEGKHLRAKTFTVQERLPKVMVAELTQEQQQDPRLIRNLHRLFSKLLFMNKVVRRVNAEVPPSARVDVQLDLGPISRMIRNARNLDDLHINNLSARALSSKNLLVNPETMDIYCVDFGKGQWSDEKEATWLLIMNLAEQERSRNQDVSE